MQTYIFSNNGIFYSQVGKEKLVSVCTTQEFDFFYQEFMNKFSKKMLSKEQEAINKN